MRIWLGVCAILAFAATALADTDVDALRASIVQVDVTDQGFDYWSPWQRPDPSGVGGSAFYIGNGRLLTNAHVVTEAKIIRVKRPDQTEKVDARVLFIAHDCDLAMLTVDDPNFFKGMVPLKLGGVPKLRSTVTAVGYPIGGRKLSITEGVVSRIEVTDYVHTGSDRHLGIQIDAAINPGNSGGPVLQNGVVVGVAFQTQFFAQSIGYMIPTPVINHFLTDIKDGKYDGYPSLGIYTTNLENKTLRQWLKLPAGQTGVMILETLPYSSCAGLLHHGDVLTQIGDFDVENDGTVKVGDDFLELSYAVQQKYAGDTLKLTVYRDGKKTVVPVKLKVWNVKMPQGTMYGKQPEYDVYGGFVFVPLSSNYVDRAGWGSDLQYWLSQFYVSIAQKRLGQEQLVVLSRVLPDDSNRYCNYRNVVVSKVNGKRPKDFADFVNMISKSDQAVIDFEGVNVPSLVLRKAEIEKVQKKILSEYDIPKASFVRKED